MAVNVTNVTPRPDLALAVMQESTLIESFIAHRVFPVMPVRVSTASIPKLLARRHNLRLYKPKYGEFPRAALAVDTAGTFDCKESGFEEPLDAKDKEALGGDQIAREIVGLKTAQTVLRAREIALATSLFSTGTFGSGYNTAGAAAWDNANGKPINDVIAACEQVRKRTGVPAYMQTLVISGGLYAKAMQNAQIQSQVRAIMGYTDKSGGIQALIAPQTLAMAFGVKEVLIGGDVYNTADEGQTASNSSVWADTYALCMAAPAEGDRFSPGLGRTFVWEDGQMGVVTEQVNDAARGLILETYDDARANAEIIRARQYLDMVMLNKDAGHLITGV